MTFMSHTDPRPFQIGALSFLLIYGLAAVDLDVSVANAVAILVAGLATQWVASVTRGAVFDPLSPLITCLSLILLLRADRPELAALAAVIAIGSKFLIRWRGRHIFNPANIGIVATALLVPGVWVSAGQWGSAALFGFAILCIGTVVVTKAVRADITAAFLMAYGGMLTGRAYWLGDPLSIPLHHMQSGALLIFAFFMISDPKSSPATRRGRVLFATIVAAGAMFVHFYLYRPNGLIWSLVCCAPLVPLIDAGASSAFSGPIAGRFFRRVAPPGWGLAPYLGGRGTVRTGRVN